MFETTISHFAKPAVERAQPYHGPERRTANGDQAAWLVSMLDEIDYGMLLVNAQAKLTYMNHAAKLELDGRHPLRLGNGILGAHRPPDVAPLYDALAAAQRGLRKLVTLGEAEQRVSVSVVPLPDVAGNGSQLTLLVLGKRHVCEHLSVQGYARSVHLTPAETRVLEQLCAGVKPNAIAAAGGVAVCTVRTQIGNIRSKTGTASIRDLVHQVAVLPPLLGALRASACVGPG